jgi:hypothetical protein
MTHERRTDLAVAHPFRRRRPGRGVSPLLPQPGLAIRQPFGQARRTSGHAVRCIVKALAVEVVRYRAVIERHFVRGPRYLSPAACALEAAALVVGAPEACAGAHFRTDVPPVIIGWMSGPKKVYG